MKLITPALEHLPSYIDALERGFAPGTVNPERVRRSEQGPQVAGVLDLVENQEERRLLSAGGDGQQGQRRDTGDPAANSHVFSRARPALSRVPGIADFKAGAPESCDVPGHDDQGVARGGRSDQGS